MSDYVFPTTDYDRPRNLLAVLGSFWANTYAGVDQLDATLRAKALVEQQTLNDLLELLNSLSRHTTPIYHTDNWYALRLLASEVNTGDVAMARFSGEINYASGAQFDVPQNRQTYGFPATADLADVNMVFNRLTEPSLAWVKGQDFTLEPGSIVFRGNPFTDTRVATRPVYAAGEVVDTEAVLWLFKGQFDWETLYRQYGYILGLRLKSSRGYRELLTAFFDALVGGTTRRNIEMALAAMTGIPLVLEPVETVERIAADRNHRLIITDRHVYRFNRSVLPTVAVGDTVTAGQSLVDALQFVEFNRGEVPADLRALAMGKGFLATCYYGDLVFENRNVPLEVTEAADDPTGFTRVEFGLGGFPLDVRKFFDEIHERGIAASQLPVDECAADQVINIPGSACDGLPDQQIRLGTLAHLLDQRPVKTGEPTAAALPRTINPLQFLVQNILRYNAALVRIKVSGLGTASVGLHNISLLRRIVPPHTAVIFLFEMPTIADSVTVEQLSERLGTFQGMPPLTDQIDTNIVTDARLGIRVVAGNYQ